MVDTGDKREEGDLFGCFTVRPSTPIIMCAGQTAERMESAVDMPDDLKTDCGEETDKRGLQHANAYPERVTPLSTRESLSERSVRFVVENEKKTRNDQS